MWRSNFTPIESRRRYDVEAVAEWIKAHIPCPVGGYENSSPQAVESACRELRRNSIPPLVGVAAMHAVFGRSLAAPTGPFENIRNMQGYQAYSNALDALIDYRTYHKPFHRTWSEVEYAVRESMPMLTDDGQLTVSMSNRGWSEFATAMFNSIPSALRGKIEDEVSGIIENSMGMSRRGRNISKLVRKHLDRLMVFSRIIQDNRADRIAGLDKDDPEAVRFRERFFLGILAGNPIDLERYYIRYRSYDEAYWRLANFVRMNRDLASRGAPHQSGARTASEAVGRRPPADTGISEAGLLGPCMALPTADTPARRR